MMKLTENLQNEENEQCCAAVRSRSELFDVLAEQHSSILEWFQAESKVLTHSMRPKEVKENLYSKPRMPLYN